MARHGDERRIALASGLSALAAATTLLVGIVVAEGSWQGEALSERRRHIAADGPPAPASRLSALSSATQTSHPVTHESPAPGSPEAATPIVQPATQPSGRSGRRPHPEVLRKYFPCRGPTVLLAPVPLPACRQPVRQGQP
jgi:hypothetical protein